MINKTIKTILRRFRKETGYIRNQKFRYKTMDKYTQKKVQIEKYKQYLYETKQMPHYCKYVSKIKEEK